MSERLSGVIEGFYGPPWSWAARAEVATWCAARGMTDYVYAPKDDPKHRDRWRDPYEDAELEGFAAFAVDGALRLGFAISPGLSMDPGSSEDRAVLAAKVDQVVEAGATNVTLALDDIPFGGGPQGEDHAALTAWLHAHLAGRASLALVPTEYVGTNRSPYLDALAGGVPPEVPIGWTGPVVVGDRITIAEAEARAASLGGRLPLLWDNYPVNDGLMSDRLFLGPLPGREPGLAEACSGYLANPMVQPRASLLPLASIAAWLAGQDALAAWEATAADLGLLAFAHACGTRLAHDAVDAAAAGDLGPARATFTDAASCGAPGLEEEAERWLTQAHREARLALRALDVLGGDTSVEQLIGLSLGWQAARRSDVSVFGSRCSVRPVLGQAADGTWAVDRAAVTYDDSAVDRLVELALASLPTTT
jgi:hyaluronoglucosaminidase